MKTILLLTSLFAASLAFGQVEINGTVFVNNGGIFYSDADVVIDPGGLLHAKGVVVLNANFNGADLLQLDPTASLTLNDGTLSLANETHEIFANLTLGADGFVEVPAGNSLTLTGDLDNKNTGQGLKLFADVNGTYSQLLTSGTITTKGTTYAEQYLTASVNEGWRQLGSPVVSTLAEIDDDFKTYYPAVGAVNSTGTVGAPAQWNIHGWDASPKIPGSDAAAKGWEEAGDNEVVFGPANNAKAYNLYVGGNFDVLNTGLLDVEGEVGNGTYTFDIFTTTADVVQGVNNTGWNLIPNPYPSNIDVGELLRDPGFDLAYQAVHIWNGKTAQYLAITEDIAIVFGNEFDTTYNVAPFQAFWVKGSDSPSSSASAGEDIVLSNTIRTIKAKGNYFKTTPEFIRLNVTAANGDVDQTILTFEHGASDQMENRDAYKIRTLNENKPSLYTSVEGKEISINRMAMPVPDKHVPLFFEQKDSRDFTIDMVQSTVSPIWMIELEDHKTGAIENLRDNSYTFKNDPSFIGNRFTVHIDRTGKKITNTNPGKVNIYGNEEGLNVTFADFGEKQAIAKVLITNLAGQIYFDGRVSMSEPFVFSVSGVTAMYIVHVTVGTQQEVGKVVK
jgi:hypothetical protein